MPVIRVCGSKQNLRDARERQARNLRKKERGHAAEEVRVVLVCAGCHGAPIHGEAVVFKELNDILCLSHGLKFKQRTEDLSMDEFKERLRESTWDAKPFVPGESAENKVPNLFVYVAPVVVPAPIPVSHSA